jgi:hypothetical protein
VAKDPELTPEEIAALRGDLLPDREAMSLLATDPTALVGGFADLPTAPGADAGTGVADTATGTAGDASRLADADASAHGDESVTDADRSEQISRTDTAMSTT